MIDYGWLVCWIMALVGFILFLFWVFTPRDGQDWTKPPIDRSGKPERAEPCEHAYTHTSNEQRIGGHTMVERRCKHCGSTHYLNADEQRT